jgi:hypothetical protein
VKLKILASPSFLSVVFSEKLFHQTFMKNRLNYTGKVAFRAKANEVDSLVKLALNIGSRDILQNTDDGAPILQ